MVYNFHLSKYHKKYDNAILIENLIYLGAIIIIGMPIIWILAIIWLLKYRNAELVIYEVFLNNPESSFRFPYINSNRNFLYGNKIIFERKLRTRMRTKKVLFGLLAIPIYGYVLVLILSIFIIPLIILYFLIHAPYRIIPKIIYYPSSSFSSNQAFPQQSIPQQQQFPQQSQQKSFSEQPFPQQQFFQQPFQQQPFPQQQFYQQQGPQQQPTNQYQTQNISQTNRDYNIPTVHCPNCQNQISKTSTFCPDCGYKLLKCAICKSPLKEKDQIGRCPNCKENYHLNHLRETIKVTGKCPVCKNELKDQNIEIITIN